MENIDESLELKTNYQDSPENTHNNNNINNSNSPSSPESDITSKNNEDLSQNQNLSSSKNYEEILVNTSLTNRGNSPLKPPRKQTHTATNTKLKESISNILQKRKEIHILDHIVETLHFSRFHLATILVGIFCMFSDGIRNFQFQITQNLLMKRFNWFQWEVSLLYDFEMLFISIGALVSTNSRSIHWDVMSNVHVATIGFLSILLIILLSDSYTYTILILVFSFCHGFIYNISKNYLLEMTPKSTRGFYFLLISSFKKLGVAVNIFVYMMLSVNEGITDPTILILGLFVAQLFLAVSLTFMLDSPRVLFHSNQLTNFYEYIIEVTGEGEDPIYNQHYKNAVISRLDLARKEIEYNYGTQRNEGFINTFSHLFSKYLWKSMFTVMFIFFSTMFYEFQLSTHFFYQYHNKQSQSILSFDHMTNSTNDSNDINGLTTTNSKVPYNYTAFFIFLSQFFLALIISFIYYLIPRVKRLYFKSFSMVICFICLLCTVVFDDYFNIIIYTYGMFAFIYYTVSFLHFSEFTTTKLRNTLSALMLTSNTIASLASYNLIPPIGMYNPNLLVVMFFLIGLLLVFLDIFVIHKSIEIKDMPLQEIEFIVMKDPAMF